MRYLPHTPDDIRTMLGVIGKAELEDLFDCVPGDCRRQAPLNLPAPLTEWQLDHALDDLARKNAVAPDYTLFLGAGSYQHHVPHTIPYLLQRSEFVTAYTPYQPEISQGTLQAIFEYQTLVSRLLGMEIANASMYDGASALAEGLLMALRVTRRSKVLVSALVHPHYRQVAQTYLRPTGFEYREIPFNSDGQGRTELNLPSDLTDVAAIAVQSPNFLGCIEDLQAWGDLCRQHGIHLVVCFTEPLAYGLYRPPGDYGADIVCGEGQSLGISPAYGGPGVGIFTSRTKYMRAMPGRLAGQTTDNRGRRGFVLTLSTREQHIRREKATSNICSNQNLCALTSAMFMASLGGSGFRKLARLNYDQAEYLKAGLQTAGCRIPFEAPTFNEFVVELPAPAKDTYDRLVDRKIIPGLRLEPYYPALKGQVVMCVTETLTKTQMDTLIEEVTR